MALRKEAQITRLTFGDDDWVDVRSERKYGDTVIAQRAAAGRLSTERNRRSKSAAVQGADISFDISAFNLALLTRMIVAWSDDVPINEDTIQELPDDIIQEVLEVIAGVEETEEEKAPLGSSSTSVLELQEESGREIQATEAGPDA